MTVEELAQGVPEANARLAAEGSRTKIIRLADRERLGGLIGPCWSLACGDCRREVHDGPCAMPTPAPAAAAAPAKRKRRRA